MADVVWSAEAVASLDAIIDYIVPHDAAAAARLRTRLVAAAAGLSHFPSRGRPAGGVFRELPSVPPYVIRYVVQDDRVVIARIHHGRQRPDA